MATLSAGDLTALWGEFMSKACAERADLSGMTKYDLKDAVIAIDQWIDNNVSSFNTALPEPSKSVLTLKQKLQIFVMVANKRWEVV